MMIGESSSQTTAAVTTAAPSAPNVNNSGHFSSFLMAHQITNDRRATSMPSGPYAYTLAGGQLSFLDCHAGGEDVSLMQGFDPASLVHAAGGSTTEPEMDAYDCDSEEVVEVAEEPLKPAGPSRSGSKRSRAAEVHNLSEKRRRSRINEKMKALQKLIPNSNKTDKASMLDEAIDYLKQLQLQVQMLSMRNGLSLHPAFVPGAMPPLQASQICLPFHPDNAALMHPGMGPLLSGDSSNSSTMNLRGLPCMPSHPSLVPTVSNINDLVASFGMDTSQAPHGMISLPVAAEGALTEVTVANRHPNPIHSSRTGADMNCLDGSALFFDGPSQLPHARHVEANLEAERMRKDAQGHFQHMHILQEDKKYAEEAGVKSENKGRGQI